MLKFSPANAKIRALANIPAIMPYLANKRKVYSFDLLSGHNCPYAKDCHARVEVIDGKRKVIDGKHMQFRCFSASQEALFTNVYNMRKNNADEVLKLAAQPMGDLAAAQAILAALPKNAGVIRIHVGGDFATQSYFDAWAQVAQHKPDILFYAYTKSLPFWVKRLGQLSPNFILTASAGGYKDKLIETYNLRQAIVVKSVKEAKKLKLPIDHDDSHAADPSIRGDFALLVHGPQKAGSEWGKAVKQLKGVGSYSR